MKETVALQQTNCEEESLAHLQVMSVAKDGMELVDCTM